MTDIVDQLRERAAERQRDGWELSDAMTPREMIDIAREIERLEADNARLRAALLEIVDREVDASGGARLADFHDIRCACGRCAADIARAALKEGKDE